MKSWKNGENRSVQSALKVAPKVLVDRAEASVDRLRLEDFSERNERSTVKQSEMIYSECNERSIYSTVG